MPTSLSLSLSLHIALASVKAVHFSLHVSQLFPTVSTVLQSCASTPPPPRSADCAVIIQPRHTAGASRRLRGCLLQRVRGFGRARECDFLIEVAVSAAWLGEEWVDGGCLFPSSPSYCLQPVSPSSAKPLPTPSLFSPQNILIPLSYSALSPFPSLCPPMILLIPAVVLCC